MGLAADLDKVFSQFAVDGELMGVVPITVGHIHQSYRVNTSNGAWFLQKINHYVFKDVAGMMANIQKVTTAIAAFSVDSGYESLRLVPTRNGQSYLEIEGGFWRMYDFKQNLKGYDLPTNLSMVAEAGKAFANFVEMLNGLDAESLAITIPNFHSLSHRMQQLETAIDQTSLDLAGLQPDLHQIRHLAKTCQQLEDKWIGGELPTRITHNDTKFNNLLFDASGMARCVIDLDTVMPGIVHFDVGDCLRTLASTTAEDEPDLSKIDVNSAYYRTFLDSYKATAKGWLTTSEIEVLPYATPYMALIMAVRFIADHLMGNVYFHCHYPGHNLVRARAQQTLAMKFLEVEGLG